MFLIFSHSKLFIVLVIIAIQEGISLALFDKKLLAEKRFVNENPVITAVTNVAKTCFSNDLNITIFAGEFENVTAWYYKFPPILPVYRTSLSNSWIFEYHKRLKGIYEIDERLVSRLKYPATINIVSVLPLDNLTDLLERMRKSVTWNAGVNTFLVDEDLNGNCTSVEKVLTKAWEFDILQAIHVCYNNSKVVEFYTINPFTKFSTGSWSLMYEIDVVHDYKNHKLRFFRFADQLSVIDSTTCQNLIFEKFDRLDDYPIKLCAQSVDHMIHYKYKPPNYPKNLPSSEAQYTQPLDDFLGFDVQLNHIIWTKLQAKATLSIFSDYGHLNKKGQPAGAFIKLFQNEYDMEPFDRFFRSFWRLFTYPYKVQGMCAMTRRISTKSVRGFISMIFQQPKVLIYVFGIGCLATIMFRKVLLRVNYVLASMEVIRALAGLATTRERNATAYKRLIFIYLIFIIFGVNLHLSSELTSSFSSPEVDNNTNTMGALVALEYKFMGHPSFSEFLYNETLRENYIESNFSNCENEITQGEKVACIATCEECMFHAMNNNDMHVSQPLLYTHIGFVVQPDWPILQKVNLIVQRIREGGIIDFEFKREYQEMISEFNERKKDLYLNPEQGFQGESLHLNTLLYTFSFYIIGMLLTFVIFIWEASKNVLTRMLCVI